MFLTVKFVENEYEKIADKYKTDRDDERLHVMEDDLHELVLNAIAAGQCEDPQRCAVIAMKSHELSFQRWCA